MASALRFPRADGSMIVVTEITHASGYTQRIRISVRHIVMYQPYGDEDQAQTVMKIDGRQQPLRIDASAEEIDTLIAAADQTGEPTEIDAREVTAA